MSMSYLRVAQPRQHSAGRAQARRDTLRDVHDEHALDEALAESFPASDPVAVAISTAVPGAGVRYAQARERPA